MLIVSCLRIIQFLGMAIAEIGLNLNPFSYG
jgi:hypothetical protein